MAAKQPLRAVRADETTPRRGRPVSVATAAASGDHRALLVAMRERIAKTVSDPDCPARDLAALTRRLQEIAKEIATIDLRSKQETAEDVDGADEAWDQEAL
jgi:hypothetical protein